MSGTPPSTPLPPWPSESLPEHDDPIVELQNRLFGVAALLRLGVYWLGRARRRVVPLLALAADPPDEDEESLPWLLVGATDFALQELAAPLIAHLEAAARAQPHQPYPDSAEPLAMLTQILGPDDSLVIFLRQTMTAQKGRP